MGDHDRSRQGLRHRPILRHLLQRHRRVQGQHAGRAASTPPPAGNTGLGFPLVTVGDMVRAQKMLIDHLGIERLLCVCGGSMGGMQALEWAVAYPEAVASCIAIAATQKHSPMQIAFNEVGRQAIMADPNWNGGDYYQGEPPDSGSGGRPHDRAHHLSVRRGDAREVRPALARQERARTTT